MFTGIVETTGRLEAITIDGALRRFTVRPDRPLSAKVGDSIAVNGTCLTITWIESGAFGLDLVEETLRRTNLGGLEVGTRLNLERAMPADGRFDGHVVQGHVDGTATLVAMDGTSGGTIARFSTGPDLLRYVVEKGSVTVDGVSLTVAAVDATGFAVALIPHTLEATRLGEASVGDLVNIEVDIIAKYVERLTEAHR